MRFSVFRVLVAFIVFTSAPLLSAPYRTQCLETLKNNLYDLQYGNRLSLCEQASSEEGIAALGVVAQTHKAISDEAMDVLVKLRNPYATECLLAFTSNLYDVTFGQRISLCAKASSAEGVEAVQIATSSTKALSDEQVGTLLAYQSPYGIQCLREFKANLYDVTFSKRIDLCKQASCREGITDLRVVTRTHESIEDADLARLLTSRCPPPLAE